MDDISNSHKSKLYKHAIILAYITILYNLIEGTVSVFFGIDNDALSLFGFGIDSIIEVISGIGIWHMLYKIKIHGEKKDEFEKTALKITGTAFYLLTAGLLIASVNNFLVNQKPETTFWGVVISLVSIFSMSLLIHFKLKVGRELNSPAIVADANCTKTCLYLSLILLVSSLGFELTNWARFDTIGALLIALFSYKEGKEAFEKAKSDDYCECEKD